MKRKPGDREVPLDQETHDMLQELREAFVQKFGREPGPDDPIFFDPKADTPQPLDMDAFDEEVSKAMAAAGISPELIYATVKTGLMVTEDNQDLIPAEDLAQWDAAIEEYQKLTEGKPS